jgi:hypothetical protein
VIVLFGPGGVADVTTRLIPISSAKSSGSASWLRMHQVPAHQVARAAISGGNDGYTIASDQRHRDQRSAVQESSVRSAEGLRSDFECWLFDCIFINAETQFKNRRIHRAVKEKPGALNIGTINPGSTQHPTAELFKSSAGVNVVIVPFRTIERPSSGCPQ